MPARGAPRRLHFLDGLRGLAAFYVLLYHEATGDIVGHGTLSGGMSLLQALLYRGHFSVVVFIVLSGFSLMLPVVRSTSEQLEAGFRGYIRRRARRILPPYYAALGCSVMLVVAENLLGSRLGLGGPVEQGALGPGSIISHLLLVQNATYWWVYRINGPLWSVATEWQIYFVFALVLLPLWRRVGAAVTVLAAWVLSSLLFFALPPAINLSWACPWFVGSFALGMAGAAISFAPGYDGSFLRNRAPWSAIAWVVLAGLVTVVATGRIDTWGLPVTDLIVSCLAFSWINALVQASARTSSQPGVMLRLLGSRTLVHLGGFSYSLYLVQFPLVRLAERLFTRLPLSHDAIVASELLIVTPVILSVAWVFSELFERPFTTGGILLPALRRRFEPAPPHSLSLPV